VGSIFEDLDDAVKMLKGYLMSSRVTRTNPNGRASAEARAVVVEGLGPRLRSLRRMRSLSLAQVAAATGISGSFLSLVENGKNDLTVARLIRLAGYYNVAVTDLLPDVEDDRPEVVRRAHQRRIPSRIEKMDIYLLVHKGGGAMTPVIATYGVGGGTHEFISYDCEQFDHVLEGTIAVVFEGDEPLVLGEGDSAYYSAKRPHKYKNVGDGPARVIHVRSPGN
jgi:transcriptional regulator with XRE-family HTH domain